MRKPPMLHLPALTLCAALAACGGESGGEQGQQAESPQTSAEAPAPPASDPGGATATAGGRAAEGQQIFAGNGNCHTCHGPEAQGSQLGPNLADQTWLWIDPAQGDVRTQLVTLIKTGVSQPKEYPAPMPPMGGVQLSDDQLEAVADYIISLGGLPAQ